MESKLRMVFDNLTCWRNLPDYQLERRADVFFSIYLPEILECKTGQAVCPLVVPEFPINKKLLYPGYSRNHSIKVDYLAFGEDKRTLFYIELKTDSESRRDRQDDAMDACSRIGFDLLFKGLKDIFIATKSKHKYFYLMCLLEDIGVIDMSNGIRDNLAETIKAGRPGIRALLDKIELLYDYPESKVVYIQPHPEADTERKSFLSFDFIAEVVSKQEGELGKVFADCLRSWKSSAGEL